MNVYCGLQSMKNTCVLHASNGCKIKIKNIYILFFFKSQFMEKKIKTFFVLVLCNIYNTFFFYVPMILWYMFSEKTCLR